MRENKIILIVFLSLIIIFLSLVVIIWIIIGTNIDIEKILKNSSTIEEVPPKGISITEVLNKKSFYSGKKITLRGWIRKVPVVCKRKECPPDDSCCGCPSERNIFLLDEKSILTFQAKEMLRLVDEEGKSFCYRQKGSCHYECGDWREDGVYEVYGEFGAESPPPGWNKSLDFYFKVEGKRIVGSLDLKNRINLLIQKIKRLVRNLKTSGEYVLD